MFFRIFYFCLVLIFYSSSMVIAAESDFDDEVNLYCLRLSIPQLRDFSKNSNGQIWINLKNGKSVPYSDETRFQLQLEGDVAQSMRQLYPLEPERPETPFGYAPGRKRPYAFFEALYGSSQEQVKNGLRNIAMPGKTFPVAMQVYEALVGIDKALLRMLEKNQKMRPLLKPEGGYYWRKIAGEKHLSAHSYGIAIDLGADVAPYWRWSRKMPHPMQKTYPREIVEEFENRGFIWGGKWHEYDLMHFEYRPELICKSKMYKFSSRPFAIPLKARGCFHFSENSF